MPDSPTAFVAGATGYTGRAVVAVMRERGARAVAHVRPDSPRLREWRQRFGALGAEVDTTPWDAGAMAATLAALRPDLVFGCLGTTRARGRQAARETGRRDTYESVDFGLTKVLIDACVAAGLRPRFVYLSSMGVRAASGNAYLDARWRTEEALRGSGLPFTIARAGFISGPDREESRPLERAGAVAVDGVLAVLGALGARDLQRTWRSSTGDELARALVRLGLDPAWEGRIANPVDLKEP